MNETKTVFEVGIRTQANNLYYKFMESENRQDAEEYLEIMKLANVAGEVILLEKRYRLVSTTPVFVMEQIDEKNKNHN